MAAVSSKRRRMSQTRRLQDLPPELLASAVGFLPVTELSRLQPVSRNMARTLENERQRRTAVPGSVTENAIGRAFAEPRQYVIVFAALHSEVPSDVGASSEIYGISSLAHIREAMALVTGSLLEGEDELENNAPREVWLFAFEPLGFVQSPGLQLPLRRCGSVLPHQYNFQQWHVAVAVMPIRDAGTREVTGYYFRDVTRMLHLDPRSGLRGTEHGAHMSELDLVNVLFGIGQKVEMLQDTPYQQWADAHCWR